MKAKCVRCEAEGPNPNAQPQGRIETPLRNLYVGCGYDMREVSGHFRLHSKTDMTFGTIICKGCRLELLTILHSFLQGKGVEAVTEKSGGKRTVKLMGEEIEVDDEEYKALVDQGVISE